MTKGADYFTAYGASVLVSQIQTYWKAKGYRGILAAAYELPGMGGIFGVRSNIGPTGYPPRSA